MARLINFEKVAIAVSSSRTSAEKEHGSSNNVWGEIFGSFTSFFGDSAISIHIESCGRLTVPITKEAIQYVLLNSEDRAFMQMAMPPEGPNNYATFIYGERVKLIPNNSLEEPLPNIISYICKLIFGTEDAKVMDDFLQLQLDKVIIIEKNDHSSSMVLNETGAYPGICYTVLLLIPTEEGFKGGQIKVINKNDEILEFDFEKQSNKDFSILIFPAENRYQIDPVNDGSSFIVVFHLVWKDSLIANSANPSLFGAIELYQDLKNLLLPWKQLLTAGILSDKVTCQFGSAKNNVSHAADEKCQDSGNMQKVVECQITSEHDVRDIDRNVSGVAQTAYELENGYLVFPLTERYSVSNTISISQLTGHDQLLAHVFQSLDFIDVHLAVISLSISADKQTRSSNSSEDSENLALKSVGVQQWIGFEDSFPQGSVYDFGACSQLIGTTQHYLSESYGANGEMLLYHYALIVQPRRQSITSSCLYNFDRALDCLEYRLWSLLRLSRPKRPSKRNLLKSDLMQMISFCADEPASVFRTSAPRAEKRSLRMLTLCLHLRAREETMAFLNLLGTGFTCDTSNDKPISSKPVLVYEGLRCEDCSRVVADLEYRVVDWKASAGVILRLISPFRIFRQLDCYISLTHHFLNRNRFEAGCQVANRISDILSKLSTEQASFLRPDQAGQYSSFIFSLELKSRAADEERLENYFAFYRKLNFAMKCQVLTDLKEHQKTSTSAKIFQEMTEVALIDTFTHESLDSAGLPIVKIALCLDNQDLHHRLITRIYEEKDESRRCNIVTRILKFLNPAELALYTESGLVVLSQLLEINIGTLTSRYAKFCNSDGSTLSEDHDPDFRSDLYSIVRLIMLMENDERCMNSSRVTKMGNVLYCLPLTAICHLIQDLRATDGEELRKHPRSCNMFFDLCQLIGLRRREFIAKLPPAMIVELLESFIWFGDLHLAGGLIRLINFEEPKNTWNQLEISSLLSVIMHTSDLWQYLVPSSSPFVCRTVNSLLGTWMMNLNQRLNELLLDDKDNLNLIQLRDPILKEAATCLSFYVRNSLKFPEDAYVNTNLVSLINLLSPLEVAHLITQIREANTVYLKIYKPKKKTAFHVFLLICTQLTNADLHDLVQSCNDALFRAVTCAFWVGIEELLIALVRRITSALPHSQENVFVCKVLASAEIRKLAEKSASNREAFYQLVEHRIDWLNFLCAIEPTKDQTTQLDAVTGHQEALRELEELCALLQNFQEPSEDTPMLCNDETEVNENYIQENSSERNTES